MHREALARSLYFSHSLATKPIGGLGLSLAGKSTRSSASLTRCYHRSLERNIYAGTTPSGVKSVDASISIPQEETVNGKVKQVKVFNIKAKDILNVPDEPVVKGSFSKTKDAEDSSIATRSLLESRIYAARTTEDLLKLSIDQDLTLKLACLIICRLGNITQARNGQKGIDLIRNDKRFIRVFNLIQRGNHSQFPHTLLLALNGLQKLGMEGSPEVSRLLERELSWSMRRCPLKFLARSVRILNDNSGRGEQQNGEVLQSAIQVLHRRWIEAITGSDFISLFQVMDILDDERKLKLEERAADVAHQFSPSETLKIFIILSSKKRRPTPLLRSLSFHFCKAEHKLNAKEAIELIYALNELTFADPILMNKLCTELAEEIPQVTNTALISSLMTSLGQMRYKNKDILLAVDEWIVKNLDKMRVFDYASWLQAAATLNYTSPNLSTFCGKAKQVLTQSSSTSPVEWVNIVHSLVLLNECNCEMMASVLKPSFVDNIEKLGLKSGKQKLKLLNINYVASHWMKHQYKGDFLDASKVKDWTTAFVSSSDEKLSKLVLDSLATFLSPSKYLNMNCQLESGVFIDAICYYDKKLSPITLEAVRSKKSDEMIKIAIVVEGYGAMCLGLKQPTGTSALSKKILDSENIPVVTVPYTEFGYSEKLVKRVQYLEQNIKATCSNNAS